MTTQDYIDDVQELYVAYFSRPADPAGLNFWASQLQAGAVNSQAISASFARSGEYRSKYEGMNNRAIVNEVYENLFSRTAEKAGIDYWAAALDNGNITIDDMVTQIALSARENDLVAFNGKVAVATSFTQRLDTQQEVLAYNNPAALQVAVDYIGRIRDLSTAAQHIDPSQIDAAIAQIVGLPSGFDAGGTGL